MIKKLIILFLLAAATGGLWFANNIHPGFYISNLLQTAFAITAIYLFFKIIFEEIVAKSITERKSRYTFNKIVSTVFYVAVALALAGIWTENARAILLSYGLVAAGLTVALGDVFRNLAGGILLFVIGTYRIGDRIEINGKYGDVIDIGIMYTTLMEIEEWIGADQPTGRLTVLPNNYVISNTVNNYTKDHSFIFDDISIPLTFESNWKKAAKNIQEIVMLETAEVTERAKKQFEAMGEDYFLQKHAVEPSVYITVKADWVKIDVRYVAEAKDRRATHSRISARIYDMINTSEDIEIGKAKVDVGKVPELKLNIEKGTGL